MDAFHLSVVKSLMEVMENALPKSFNVEYSMRTVYVTEIFACPCNAWQSNPIVQINYYPKAGRVRSPLMVCYDLFDPSSLDCLAEDIQVHYQLITRSTTVAVHPRSPHVGLKIIDTY